MTPPDTQTTLDLLDEALATGCAGAGDAELRELQELALALSADSPEPDAEFASELQQLVRDGFPRARPRMETRIPAFVRRFPRPRGRRPLLAGAAAAVLLAGVIAVAVSTDPDGGAGDTRDVPAASVPQELHEMDGLCGSGNADCFRSAGGTARSESLPALPGDAALAPEARERRIERSARITLAAPDDELEEVAAGINRVADRHRGFVLRSEISSGERGSTGGTFELRIPQESLQPALGDLAELGDVRARSQSGEDVTAAYVSARDRYDAAQAERRSLVRRLRRADSDSEADRIRDRLFAVSAEVRAARADLRRLRERTNYAAVSVDLERKGGDRDSGSGSANGTGDALDDALGSLVGSLNLALRVLGVLIPLALLGTLGWLAVALLRRRRREAALL
jgi:Domain of unknown function (DUF4349)